jgi:hypothetical protein
MRDSFASILDGEGCRHRLSMTAGDLVEGGFIGRKVYDFATRCDWRFFLSSMMIEIAAPIRSGGSASDSVNKIIGAVRAE